LPICVDAVTDVATRAIMQSHLRFATVNEDQIPFEPRRVMQANGIRSDQVTQIRGFADQRLANQTLPSPRRTGASPIVRYITKNNDDENAKPAARTSSDSEESAGKPAAKE